MVKFINYLWAFLGARSVLFWQFWKLNEWWTTLLNTIIYLQKLIKLNFSICCFQVISCCCKRATQDSSSSSLSSTNMDNKNDVLNALKRRGEPLYLIYLTGKKFVLPCVGNVKSPEFWINFTLLGPFHWHFYQVPFNSTFTFS